MHSTSDSYSLKNKELFWIAYLDRPCVGGVRLVDWCTRLPTYRALKRSSSRLHPVVFRGKYSGIWGKYGGIWGQIWCYMVLGANTVILEANTVVFGTNTAVCGEGSSITRPVE